MADQRILQVVLMALGLVTLVVLIEYWSSNFQLVTLAMNFTPLYFLPIVDSRVTHWPHKVEVRNYSYEVEYHFSKISYQKEWPLPKGKFNLFLLAGSLEKNVLINKHFEILTSPIRGNFTLSAPIEEVEAVWMSFRTEFEDDCKLFIQFVSLTPLYLDQVDRDRKSQLLCPLESPSSAGKFTDLDRCLSDY